MDKIIYLAILSVVGVFVFRKMFHPPVGPQYPLKTILFAMGGKEIPNTTELGRHLFTSKAKNKWILPWEFDLWKQVDLFENGIVLKRHQKEKRIFFHEMYAIEPLLVNTLFVKGKYFGYALEGKDGGKIILKSCNLYDLDIFISELCSLFPSEKGEAVIADVS